MSRQIPTITCRKPKQDMVKTRLVGIAVFQWGTISTKSKSPCQQHQARSHSARVWVPRARHNLRLAEAGEGGEVIVMRHFCPTWQPETAEQHRFPSLSWGSPMLLVCKTLCSLFSAFHSLETWGSVPTTAKQPRPMFAAVPQLLPGLTLIEDGIRRIAENPTFSLPCRSDNDLSLPFPRSHRQVFQGDCFHLAGQGRPYRQLVS